MSGIAPQLTATNGFDAALAGAVDGARDQLLADAGLALDQHRNGRRRGLLGGAQHAVHAGAAGDDVLEGERAGAAALDAVEFAFERARGERVAQRHLQALGADRLDHEVGRARAHRIDDVVDAAVRGLHDHRDAQARLAHPGEHAQAVEIGHHEVENDGIDARGLGAGEQLGGGIAAFGKDRLVAGLAHHVIEKAAGDGIVIDDQNTLTHVRYLYATQRDLGESLLRGDSGNDPVASP